MIILIDIKFFNVIICQILSSSSIIIHILQVQNVIECLPLLDLQ